MEFKLLKAIVVIVLFLFLTGKNYSQSIEEVISSFDHPNTWVVELNADSSYFPLFDRHQLGSLTFKNNKREVGFLLFKYNALDSLHFASKTLDYYAISSCRSSHSGNPIESFTSFEKNGYYFVLRMCNNCNTEKDKKCKKLANKLFKWIFEIE